MVLNIEQVKAVPLAQVPDIPIGEPFAQEWQTFKREVGRLIREGHAGRFALLQGDRVLGIWDTLDEADQAARTQCNSEPTLIQEIQTFLRPITRRSER